jgi:peptidyl-prolyl cis-trans isomerase D
MLALFRRKKSSLKWVLWLVIVVLGAGMVFLFVNPPSGTPGTFGNDVASVGDRHITIQQFRRQYGQMMQLYQQQFGDQFEQFREQLRVEDQVINSLINEYAIANEAERLGLAVTPEEISDRVTALPVFQEEGTGRFIGVTRYQQVLAANNLMAAEFEDGIRRQVLREKLSGLLIDGIEPQPSEVRQQFVDQNQQVRIDYVAFDPETVDATDFEDDELTEFYEGNSGKYTISEKRQIQYLRIPLDRESVSVGEDEIQARAQGIPEGEQVRASHILFRVAQDADDTEIRRKATRILRQIRQGADFAEMAKLHSDDGSSSTGGDLGFFARGTMVPEFEGPSFTLGVGEVSDLIQTPFGIHIIKVTAKPGDARASQRAVAEFQLRQESAERAASSRANSLLEELKGGATLEDVAQRDNLEIVTSAFFALDDPPPSTGLMGDFNQQAFAAPEGEFLDDPYQAQQGFFVARVAAVQAAKLQALEEVRDRVIVDFNTIEKGNLNRKRAEDFFRAASEGGLLAETAEAQGLAVVTTDFFKKGATVDDTVKFSPILHSRAFTMKPGELSPPVDVTGKLVVFQLKETSDLDAEAFEQERQSIADSLRETQRNAFFQSYMQGVVDKLRQDEQISINQELLDQITG